MDGVGYEKGPRPTIRGARVLPELVFNRQQLHRLLPCVAHDGYTGAIRSTREEVNL
jgi:hypothetical protein